MSLRASAAPIVSRTIAVPSDRTGRLRSIGWLAGNLVRDQIGPIVATAEAPPPPPVEAHPAVDPPLLAASASPALAAVDPPSVAASAPPPPATSAPRPVSSTPAAVVASPPASAVTAIPHAAWSITVSGGPAMSVMREAIMGQNVMHGSALPDRGAAPVARRHSGGRRAQGRAGSAAPPLLERRRFRRRGLAPARVVLRDDARPRAWERSTAFRRRG